MVLVDSAEIWGRPSVRRKALASNQIICRGHQRLCLKHIQTGRNRAAFQKQQTVAGFSMTCKSLKRWSAAHTSSSWVGGVKLISTDGHISIVAFDCRTAFNLLACAHAHSSFLPFFETVRSRKPHKCVEQSLRNIMEASWCNTFCSSWIRCNSNSRCIRPNREDHPANPRGQTVDCFSKRVDKWTYCDLTYTRSISFSFPTS